MKPIVCFDVDGTLITFDDKPRYEVIQLLRQLSNSCRVFVWSGGGIDYAYRWVDKLGLPIEAVIEKGSIKPDIAFDDEEVKLGKVNIRV